MSADMLPAPRPAYGKGLLGRHRSHHSIPSRVRVRRPDIAAYRPRLPLEAVPAFFAAGEDSALLLEVRQGDGGEDGELVMFTAVVDPFVDLDCSLCCVLVLCSRRQRLVE